MEMNKKVSKTFSMQNFKENEGGIGPNGQSVTGSIQKGQVGRKVIDSTKSDMPSHMQEESQQNLMT